MATNYIQDGDVLRITVGSTVDSGDPVVSGAIRGVALTDYSSADGKASVKTQGVFDLSVKGIDDAGNSAVAVGDKLFYVAADTPKISKKKSGDFFGIALETVDSGATATINVKLAEGVALDDGYPTIFAAGVYTCPASPADDETVFITVTGILATDQVFVQQVVDSAASPSNQILTAIAQASPAGILVTCSGAPTAADKFNYVVIRA